MGTGRGFWVLALAGCTFASSPDRIFVGQAGSATVLAIDADSGAIEARAQRSHLLGQLLGA